MRSSAPGKRPRLIWAGFGQKVLCLCGGRQKRRLSRSWSSSAPHLHPAKKPQSNPSQSPCSFRCLGSLVPTAHAPDALPPLPGGLPGSRQSHMCWLHWRQKHVDEPVALAVPSVCRAVSQRRTEHMVHSGASACLSASGPARISSCTASGHGGSQQSLLNTALLVSRRLQGSSDSC